MKLYDRHTLRHSLLLLLVAIALVLGFLPGCAATPDTACNRQAYWDETDFPSKGQVVLSWNVGPTSGAIAQVNCDDTHTNCHATFSRKPTFRDSCSMLDLGHEIGHALGKKHSNPVRQP